MLNALSLIWKIEILTFPSVMTIRQKTETYWEWKKEKRKKKANAFARYQKFIVKMFTHNQNLLYKGLHTIYMKINLNVCW